MMCVLTFSTSNHINTIMSSFLVRKLRPRNLKEVVKPGFECGHEEASVLLTCLTAVSGVNHLFWSEATVHSGILVEGFWQEHAAASPISGDQEAARHECQSSPHFFLSSLFFTLGF